MCNWFFGVVPTGLFGVAVFSKVLVWSPCNPKKTSFSSQKIVCNTEIMTTSDGDESLFSDSTATKARKAKAKTEESKNKNSSDDSTITINESNDEEGSSSSSSSSSKSSSDSEDESDDDGEEQKLTTPKTKTSVGQQENIKTADDKDEVPAEIKTNPTASSPDLEDEDNVDAEEETEQSEIENGPEVSDTKRPYLFSRNKEGYLEIGFSTMGTGEGKFTSEDLQELKDNFYFNKSIPFSKKKAIKYCYSLRAEVKRLAYNAMTKLIVQSAHHHKLYLPGKHPVRTFGELKKCWKARERKLGTLRALHRIMYSDWEKRCGWQDQMERNIMASLKLIYVAQPAPKMGRPKSGCIHKMIGHQINELRRQIVRKTGYAFERKIEPPFDDDKWFYLQTHPDFSEADYTVSNK